MLNVFKKDESAARIEADILNGQIDSLQTVLAGKETEIEALTAQNAELQAELKKAKDTQAIEARATRIANVQMAAAGIEPLEIVSNTDPHEIRTLQARYKDASASELAKLRREQPETFAKLLDASA